MSGAGHTLTCAQANAELHWVAQRTTQEACADGWKWASLNPNGYTGVTSEMP